MQVACHQATLVKVNLCIASCCQAIGDVVSASDTEILQSQTLAFRPTCCCLFPILMTVEKQNPDYLLRPPTFGCRIGTLKKNEIAIGANLMMTIFAFRQLTRSDMTSVPPT